MIIFSLMFLLISFFVSSFFPLTFGNLSFWTPNFFLCYLLLCRYRIKEDRIFYRYVILFGLGYGILCSHYWFFEVVLGVLLSILLTWFKRYLEINYLTLILYFLLCLMFYESVSYLCYSFFHLVSFSWYSLFYKISHTILFNLLLLELGYLFFRKCFKTNHLGSIH